MKYLGEQSLTSLIAIIKTAMSGLLSKPSTTGTTGQVLKLGSDGTTEWGDAAPAAPSTTNLLKGDGEGGMTAAVPGTDYIKTAPVASVNSKTGAVTLGASDVGAVPTARKVNNKALSADISLTASDVGALASTTTYVSSVDGASGAITTNAVKTSAQTLTDTQKAQARANIGAGTSSFSGKYDDLTGAPTIPTVGSGTLTIQKNSSSVGTFSANATSNATVNITVPTTADDVGAQSKITATGILEGDGSGGVTAADTLEAEVVEIPTGMLKGSASGLEAAVAGTDYAPAYTYSTEDLTAGTSELATGTLYIVYE